jgi:hypothetical protein
MSAKTISKGLAVFFLLMAICFFGYNYDLSIVLFGMAPVTLPPLNPLLNYVRVYLSLPASIFVFIAIGLSFICTVLWAVFKWWEGKH